MSAFPLDYLKEKFIRLVMNQQSDAKINEVVNNAIQKYSLDSQNSIKMDLAL